MPRIINTQQLSEVIQRSSYGDTNVISSYTTGSITKSDIIKNVRQSDGFQSPSDYSVLVTSQPVVLPVGGTVSYPWGGGHTWEGAVCAALKLASDMTPAQLHSSYSNELRTKLLINLKDEILDVAMVIAEMQGTADLLTTSLERIARSMDAIKKRKPASFRYLMHGQKPLNLSGKRLDNFNREVAGTFLEWKYGIMPTVMDVQGACKALDINEEGALFNNPAALVARASLGGVSDGTSFVRLGAPCWSGFMAPTRTRWNASARVDYTVNAEGIRGLNRYGLGLGTVSTVLLERTPFSFVLNMVFPIMDLVKAWTATGGCDVRGFSETFFVSSTAKKMSWKDPSNWGLRIDLPGDESVSSFIRKTGTSVPFPTPFIRNPIKVGNLASVLALFTQLRSNS